MKKTQRDEGGGKENIKTKNISHAVYGVSGPLPIVVNRNVCLCKRLASVLQVQRSDDTHEDQTDG